MTKQFVTPLLARNVKAALEHFSVLLLKDLFTSRINKETFVSLTCAFFLNSL